MESRSALLIATSVVYFVTGVAYAIGTIPVLRYLIQYRSLPTIAGIKFYSGSYIEKLGLNWVIASSILFILVGIADLAVAYGLWNSQKWAGVLAFILFPLIMAVSLGGQAPFPLILEPVKIILIVILWSSLN